MKHSLIHRILIAILATAVLTACQMEPATFSFAGTSSVSASATYVTGTKAALQTTVPDSFTLFACSYSGSTPTGVDYIYGETMTKSDSKWVSANKFGKVASDKTVKYFAVYPSDATNLVLPSADASGAPVFGYTLPVKPKDQSDIIIAEHDYPGSQENITLAFSHALSAVTFKFASDGAFDGTIKTIAVKNVKTKGNYILGTGWSNLSTPGTVTQTVNRAFTSASGGADISTSTAAMLLIPQTAGADAVLEVVANDGTRDVTLECSLSGEVFAAGKEYAVALGFSAITSQTLIIQSIDITAWINDTTKYTLSEVFEYTKNIPAGEFKFPVMTFSPGVELVIDWGDGTNDKFQMQSTQSDGNMNLKHTYATSGNKTIKVYARGGTISFSDRYKTLEGNPYTILNSTICQADIIGDYIKFNVTGTLQAPINGGTNTIEVEATDNWTITCPDWVTASPSSGGEGTTEVTLTVTENTTYAQRTGTVMGSLGVASSSLSYSQYPEKLVRLEKVNWGSLGSYGKVYTNYTETEKSLYSKVDIFTCYDGNVGQDANGGYGNGGNGGRCAYVLNIPTSESLYHYSDMDYWLGNNSSDYKEKVLGAKGPCENGWKIPFLATGAPYSDKLFGAGGGCGAGYGYNSENRLGGADGGGNGAYLYNNTAAQKGSFYGAGGGGGEKDNHQGGAAGYVGCIVYQFHN